VTGSGWIFSFSPETWQQFIAKGASVGGFSRSQRNAAERIRSGDYLFSYISGLKCFSGMYRAQGGCCDDSLDSPFGPRTRFSLLIKLEPLTVLEPASFIPLESLAGKLQVLRGIKSPNLYHAFRISPRSITSKDRDYLFDIFA
jgi:hypothetical protein